MDNPDLYPNLSSGHAALQGYAERWADGQPHHDDWPSIISDLVADLMHLSGMRGLDPEEMINRARMHYEAEKEGRL